MPRATCCRSSSGHDQMDTAADYPPQLQELIDDFVSLIHRWDVGEYAIAVGGSVGKGRSDDHSDVDLRFYHEQELPGRQADPGTWKRYDATLERWEAKGITVDGIWPRRIGAVDAALDAWLSGDTRPDDLVWAVWGYHILPDMYHQTIIEDPFGVIAGWQQRLRDYPPTLKEAVLQKNLTFLRYWRDDYHYVSKVKRGDMVFLAGLSAKLVHAAMQVLFALNETYFVGDGQNLVFAREFQHGLPDLDERVRDVLYPCRQEGMFEAQYAAATRLIDDILQLADSARGPE